MSNSKPSSIVKGHLISIPNVRFAITGKFNAPKGKSEMGAGKSYIPPLTLNMHNPSPHKQLTLRGLYSAAQTLPKSFSWNNDSEVEKYKGGDMKNLIMKPLNQLKCGSCWAFAVSTALSDRIAIKQGVNPQLGPTYLLACSVSGNCDKDALNGCSGGMIAAALENLNKPIGGVQGQCWNYDFCSNCSGDGDSDNALIPNFPQNSSKCISDTSAQLALYKVSNGSVKTLPGSIAGDNGTQITDYTAIKQSIFNDGPLPTGYIVYQDFFLGTAPSSQGGDNWKPTNGIYIHLDTENETGFTPAGDKSPYTYGSAADLNTEAGAHAVVIVGWGQDEIPNIVPKAWSIKYPGQTVPDKITIPYWVVRNSWGESWCNKGFFKIACSDPSLHINNTVMFDQTGENSLGGIIEFHPDLSTAPPPILKNSKSSFNMIWVIFLILVVAGIFIFFTANRKHKHR